MKLLGVIGYQEFFILFLVISILPFIFFLITQQNTLKAIQPQNRKMTPGEVWIQLIPFLGLIWQFFVVSRIADSIQRELLSENTFSFEQSADQVTSPAGAKPTYNIGIAYCVLVCASIIPMLGTFAALAGIICWIIYWVQLAEQKNIILRRNAV